MGLLTKIFGGNADGPSAEDSVKANANAKGVAPPLRPPAPPLEPQRSPARLRPTAEALRRALESQVAQQQSAQQQAAQQKLANVPKNGMPKPDGTPSTPNPARVHSPLIVSGTSLTVDELLAPTGRAPLPTLNGGFVPPDGSPAHNPGSTWARTGLGPPASGAPPMTAAVALSAVPAAAGTAAAVTAPAVTAPAVTPAGEEPESDAVPDAVSEAIELLVDVAFRLALGPISEDWQQAGARAAHTLELAARRGWQPHLLASFEALGKLLAEGARTRALPVVWRLSDSVPDWPASARNLRETARRRERRLLSEILLGVDGLRERARSSFVREKTLAHLVGATPELLAEELATPVERARELARFVSSYEAERRSRPVDLGHRLALQHATLALEQRQRDFEACDEDPGEARQERRQAVLRVNLLLAERGDIELLDELEPLAIAERIERLRSLFRADSEQEA